MKKIHLSKPELLREDYNAIQNSLKTGWLTHGPSNLIFEKSLRLKSTNSIAPGGACVFK